MKLILSGHDDRYAVEQLQMALFPNETLEASGQAVSALHRGKTWLTAVTVITQGDSCTQKSIQNTCS